MYPRRPCDSEIIGVDGRGWKRNISGRRGRDRTCHSRDTDQVKGQWSLARDIESPMIAFSATFSSQRTSHKPEMRPSDNVPPPEVIFMSCRFRFRDNRQ